MYKDKDKQREKDKERQRRHRAKSVTKGVADIRCDKQSVTQYPRVSDQDFTRLMDKAGTGHVRVSKPGDADYVPQCETTKAFVEDRPKVKLESKRGRDIKTFDELPPDVQQTINTMSVVEGVIDQTIKANRTAIAIHYQHTFPERYYT